MQERPRLRQAASGLGALAGLLVLVVGVPVALWKLVGRPIPTSMPSWSETRDVLASGDLPDSTLLKTVAVVAWLAWLQIAASTVVELGAWLRGRPARRLRSAGMVQPAVRRLVATATIMISTATSNSSLAAASQAPPPTAGVEHTPPLVATAFLTQHRDAAAPAPGSPAYVVQRRDTLWGLAEAHLGDPFRWRELYELNHGVRQADGRALTDPNLIRTGWVLTFPADAAGLAPPEAPTTTAAPVEPVSASADPFEPDQGQEQALTAATEMPTTSPDAPTPASSSPSAPATTAPAAHDSAHTTDQPTGETSNRSPRVALPAVGGGLFAASLLVVLTRLRQVQQRRRQPGQRPHRPRPDLAPIETALRVNADTDDAQLLDLGLRAFLDGLQRQTTPTPVQVQAVRLLDHRLEVLLDRAIADSPEGFEDLGERRVWRSTRTLTGERLARLAAASPAPLPGLVALGVADGGELLIDLETVGLLAVAGSDERTESLLRRVAAELATSTWADHLDVVIADPKLGDLTGTHRMRLVRSVDEALDELSAAGRSIGAALDAAGCANTLAGRAAGLGTADWTPTVFLHAGPLTPGQRDRLGAIVKAGGRGVAAVIAADQSSSAWSIAIGDSVARVEPLGISFTPHLLDIDVASAIDELLTDTAIDDPQSEPHQPTSPRNTVNAGRAGLTEEAPYVDRPFDVEVRVLGDVEIAGASFDRRRVVELIAYLALHPGGVTDDRLKTALWPDQAPSTATFNTTVSHARNGLGRIDEHSRRFPHFAATGNLYRLDSTVTCDALRVEARVQHARQCGPTAAIETLRSALELVRGMPFTAASGYEWAHTEGLIACYEAMIGDAAHHLAMLYLDARNADGATWAALQGLKASPGNEVLYRDRMLACHLTGNLAAVKAVLNELCEVVEANEPYDSLHPDTVALYERLVGAKRLS